MRERTILVLFAAAILQFSSAFADHTLPSGSLGRLRQDTARLDSTVRYSTLRYDVKLAVSRFAYDVERFVQCSQFRGENRDHDLIPEHCEQDMHQVHYSFYSVDRFLYDTYYDYPQVYRVYTTVKNDLRSLPH